MKILKLTAENVKRLHAVEITPEGDLVVIGGNNAQGKTSVLDAISMALGGGGTACDAPLHKGASKGRTVVELDGLTVTRTYTAGGTALTVTKEDGAKCQSPQTLLDELVGKLTFDPLDFMRMKPDARLETLREIVGINFTLVDQRRQKLFDQRTNNNRDLKRVTGMLASLPHHQGAPSEEVSVAELSAQLTDAQEHNRANQEWKDDLETYNRRIDDGKGVVAETEKRLSEARALLAKLETERAETSEHVRNAVNIDTAPIIENINNAEQINRSVRANVQHADATAAVKAKEKESADLTRSIDEIDDKKRQRLSQAKFPVDGLTFDDTGVIFNGVPFEQASGAEKLRVSVAIGMAANPKLRVLLCRDGSLLDDHSMKLLADIVREKDYQLWIERVGEGKECSVIIEDGYVKEAEAE